MSIDYDALRGNAGGDPPDGIHKATLVVAKLVEHSNGIGLVTEWQVGGMTPYYWTTWFGFEGPRLAFTQEFLDSLGVDRSQITDDDAFGEALYLAQGKGYDVKTASWSGGINTYVQGPASDAAQPQLGDVPIETAGLPQVSPVPVPAGPQADDDIPF
jgi:hypothetical protein